MGSHDPFGHLKHRLWPKESRKSNWQFDYRPLEVKNRPDFLTCRWRVTYRWKNLDKGYNFYLYLISIRSFHTKLWAPKVARISALGISKLPHGIPGRKWHLGVGPLARHIIYYKGEGGGFPQSGLWWVSWVRFCSWLVCAPKCSN